MLLLAALFFLVIAIALNFVFTPEKITSEVVKDINYNLNATLKVESIEITFFSSFPKFSLAVKNGVILNPISLDSLQNNKPLKQDSLFSFNNSHITVRPIAFLRKSKIMIDQVLIDQPHIYAFVNKEGLVNWDVLKTADEKEAEIVNVETDTTKFKADINIEDITITNARLIYDDRTTQLYASTTGFHLAVKATYHQFEPGDFTRTEADIENPSSRLKNNRP